MGDQYKLSVEEKSLLIDIVFKQQYALELVTCELSDIENGDTLISTAEYQALIKLYDKLAIK